MPKKPAHIRKKLSRRSRRKGAEFERLLASELRPIYGVKVEVKRGIGQTRAGGDCPDVDGTPWWVEAKHRKAVNIPAALAQAAEASKGRRPSLAITRANGGPIVVSMLLTDFKRLVTTPDLKPLWCDDCAMEPMPPSYCTAGVCLVGRPITKETK